MASNKRMTHHMAVLLAEKLKAVCRTEEGMALYKEGYDDKRVAAEFDGELATTSVALLRRSMFGDLRTGRAPNSGTADLLKRIEALEAWAAKRPVHGFKREAS